MSDHEGGELDNWEVASLPGGFASSFKGSGHQSLDHDIVAQHFDAAQPQRPQYAYQPRRRPTFQAREGYRPIIQSIPGIAQRTTGIQSRKKTTLPRHPDPAFIKHKSGVQADAQYQLSVTWKALVSNMRSGPDQTPAQAARKGLDDICLKTDAYIATPLDEDTRVAVWGTTEQVDQALIELESFELYVREIGVRPKQGGWHKEKAFDGRFESRHDEDEREKAMAEGLRILGTQDTDYDFEAFFLWPEEIDIDKFISRHDATTFNEIRGSILCKIEFFPTGIKHVKIFASTENNLIHIYMRLLNMVKEDIAQVGRFIISNRFRLPRAHMFRDRVGLGNDPETNLYMATLYGNPLPDSELKDWDRLCLAEEEKNRNLISSAIEMSIKSLQASQRHVRMRVTFGELGFSKLELPRDGDAGYEFDEFCSMITKRRTAIESMGLRNHKGKLEDLVDILSAMPQFSELEMRYILHFDFEGRNNHTLRFESEFQYLPGSEEISMSSSRWLEFGRVEDSEILEVNVLDFEHLRTNCQFHIGATKIYSPGGKGAQSELDFFRSNVKLAAPTAGIKAPPRRRAIYPPGRPDLILVEEVSVARFRFKEGDGYLELQRKDIYYEQQKTATPLKSFWSAKYYYPEWDNILGQFASLEPGQDVRWARKLETFFVNPKAANDWRALPKGFDAFMAEVQEISGLLQEGMEYLPEVQVKKNDETNGGMTGESNGYYGSLMD